MSRKRTVLVRLTEDELDIVMDGVRIEIGSNTGADHLKEYVLACRQLLDRLSLLKMHFYHRT